MLSLVEIDQWFWKRKYLNFINVLSLFPNISPWKKERPFMWTNLNSLHPRMLCAQFGWNWPKGSWEEEFLNFFNVFSIFRNSLLGPSFEQTWILYTKGCFVPSLVEIGPVVLEKKIFKFCQCIFAISQLSTLGKGRVLHLNKLEFTSPKDALCQV